MWQCAALRLSDHALPALARVYEAQFRSNASSTPTPHLIRHFPCRSGPLTLFVNLKRLLTTLFLLLRPRTANGWCVGAIELSELAGRIEPEGSDRSGGG